uniref:Prostaglandin E2 receptor EP3 subtype n=1 Tax=Castor canadensis TaxID=51338 RepID=A0A8C0WHP2_CASCN
MKDTRGDGGGVPLCTRFNHSYSGMWGPERSAEVQGNLTRPPGTSEDCGSVSVAFPITMMITGFVGNALAMLLVSRSYRRRESKRKKSFLLCIGWLALTDLVGQLLTSPVVIVVYLSKQRWEQLDPSGRLCTFFGLTMTVFGLSSLFIASAMAVERALAIRAPHWYASHMKTRATRAVLLGVWLAVLTFALLPVLGVGQYTIQWPGTWCFISTGQGGNETSSSHNWGNLVFASTFAFLGLLALAVTFACNLATIKALVSRCRAKAAVSQSSAQWGRITTETAIQLMGIMCVLSVCWSPLLVGSFGVWEGWGKPEIGDIWNSFLPLFLNLRKQILKSNWCGALEHKLGYKSVTCSDKESYVGSNCPQVTVWSSSAFQELELRLMS